MESTTCPVCGCSEAYKQCYYDSMTVFYECPVCGRYEFTEKIMMSKSLDFNKLPAYLFYKGFQDGKGNDIEYRYHTTLDKEKCDEYVQEFKSGNGKYGHPVHMDNDIINIWYPKSFSDKTDMILLKLDNLTDYVGQELGISQYELYGLTFVEKYKKGTKDELSEDEKNRQALFFVKYLIEIGFIKGVAALVGNKIGPISITPKGYQRIDEIQKNTSEGRNVLVAMKFGTDTTNLRESIKIGIRNAGYNPILIDEVEHNELITPELLKYIRDSKFVVVDLSHQNNGAYFEEGYAMGLGKPVIQLCKEGTKLHFDIAQKNTIIWENESDIPLKLQNRIKATID